MDFVEFATDALMKMENVEKVEAVSFIVSFQLYTKFYRDQLAYTHAIFEYAKSKAKDPVPLAFSLIARTMAFARAEIFQHPRLFPKWIQPATGGYKIPAALFMVAAEHPVITDENNYMNFDNIESFISTFEEFAEKFGCDPDELKPLDTSSLMQFPGE